MSDTPKPDEVGFLRYRTEHEEPSQPDPGKDGPRRLLWEAIQYLRGVDGSEQTHKAINLVDQRIDELLRVLPPEGGPRQDEPSICSKCKREPAALFEGVDQQPVYWCGHCAGVEMERLRGKLAMAESALAIRRKLENWKDNR